MFRMIRVGLALAYIQGIVVVAIAIVFAVVHHDGIVGNSAALIDTPEKSEIMESYALILRYTYFFLALGITLTHGRWTEIAVEDIRRSSLELDSFGTSQTIESIFGQFVIVTICFGIAVLRPPPGFMGALVNPLEAWWISSAIWSGAMSAVMVAFGVSAAAAKEAMQEPHVPRRKIDVSAIVQLSRTAVFRCRTLGAPKWSVR